MLDLILSINQPFSLTVLFLYVLVKGHRENEDSTNKGNFLKLLKLRRIDNELIRHKKDELKYTHYDSG